MTAEELIALLERTQSNGPIPPQPSPAVRAARTQPHGNDLRSMPWWTDADRAELDVYVRELVDDVHEHRQAGCALCAARGPACLFVRAAVARVVDWRDTRILRSRAAWLRAREDGAA